MMMMLAIAIAARSIMVGRAWLAMIRMNGAVLVIGIDRDRREQAMLMRHGDRHHMLDLVARLDRHRRRIDDGQRDTERRHQSIQGRGNRTKHIVALKGGAAN